MKEIMVTIMNKCGIHLRPASLFVQTAAAFNSEILIVKDGKSVSAKEIMNIIMLQSPKGTELKIIANGADEDEALAAILDLVEVKTFNEE